MINQLVGNLGMSRDLEFTVKDVHKEANQLRSKILVACIMDEFDLFLVLYTSSSFGFHPKKVQTTSTTSAVPLLVE